MNEKRFRVKLDAKSEAYLFLLYMRYGAKTREQKEAALKEWNLITAERKCRKEKSKNG